MHRLCLNTPVKYMEEIGRGSHGIVYKGIHDRWKDVIAVKRVPKRKTSWREVEILEQIDNCPNIPKYYGYYEEDSDLVIAMEYIAGIPLTDVISLAQRSIFLSEEEVRTMAWQLVEVMHFLHHRNILYGDFKPANIMYVPKPVKVVDFSCSRFYMGTNLSRAIGSPLFFAPEKFANNFGLPSDTWSLGVVLYMLFTGIHPFVHDPATLVNKTELEHEVYKNNIHFQHPHWDMVSDSAKELLKGMLEKNPEFRPDVDDIVRHPWFQGLTLSPENIH
jgi:calcium-dependent protein kinase